jgi:ElaB/YqjD/DUF883 family membrane-anchored ribosome-binding protein
MTTPDNSADNSMASLAADARALLAATAGVAGDKVSEARERLAAALESGKKTCTQVKEQVVAGAKATDEAIHKHPYLAIGVAVGVGALIGFLLARRSSRGGN